MMPHSPGHSSPCLWDCRQASSSCGTHYILPPSIPTPCSEPLPLFNAPVLSPLGLFDELSLCVVMTEMCILVTANVNQVVYVGASTRSGEQDLALVIHYAA